MVRKHKLQGSIPMTESKALARIETLAIQKIDVNNVISSLRESGLTGFNPFQFDQIRVPGAGSLSYAVKTEDGEVPMQYLDVVILHAHATRQYYSAAYDTKNPQASPPDCVSYDGSHGVGNPGGDCARCPLGKFQGGCNPGYFVYLLFPDRTMPVKFNVPRTSIANFEKYRNTVGMSGQFLNQLMTRISLEKRKQGLGMVAAFKTLYPLTGEVADAARGYARMLAGSLAYPTFESTEVIDPTAKSVVPTAQEDDIQY